MPKPCENFFKLTNTMADRPTVEITCKDEQLRHIGWKKLQTFEMNYWSLMSRRRQYWPVTHTKYNWSLWILLCTFYARHCMSAVSAQCITIYGSSANRTLYNKFMCLMQNRKLPVRPHALNWLRQLSCTGHHVSSHAIVNSWMMFAMVQQERLNVDATRNVCNTLRFVLASMKCTRENRSGSLQ